MVTISEMGVSFQFTSSVHRLYWVFAYGFITYVRQVGVVQHWSFTLYSTASSKPRGGFPCRWAHYWITTHWHRICCLHLTMAGCWSFIQRNGPGLYNIKLDLFPPLIRILPIHRSKGWC